VGYHQSVGDLETGVQSHRGDDAFPWPQRRCSSRLPGPIQSGGGQVAPGRPRVSAYKSSWKHDIAGLVFPTLEGS